MCFYVSSTFHQFFTYISVSSIDPSYWISQQSSHYTLEQSIYYISKPESLLYINLMEDTTTSRAIMNLQVFLLSHILRLCVAVCTCVCVCVYVRVGVYEYKYSH